MFCNFAFVIKCFFSVGVFSCVDVQPVEQEPVPVKEYRAEDFAKSHEAAVEGRRNQNSKIQTRTHLCNTYFSMNNKIDFVGVARCWLRVYS